jgi:hypothetical protein
MPIRLASCFGVSRRPSGLSFIRSIIGILPRAGRPSREAHHSAQLHNDTLPNSPNLLPIDRCAILQRCPTRPHQPMFASPGALRSRALANAPCRHPESEKTLQIYSALPRRQVFEIIQSFGPMSFGPTHSDKCMQSVVILAREFEARRRSSRAGRASNSPSRERGDSLWLRTRCQFAGVLWEELCRMKKREVTD